MQNNSSMHKVVLITGAARRIGAAIARQLHSSGMRTMVHYHRSRSDADALIAELNRQRAGSAAGVTADLLNTAELAGLVAATVEQFGRLDALVNNASTFYSTPLDSLTEQHWDDLTGSNLKAPLFLSQAAAGELAKQHGAIVNIVDVYAERPLADHSIYCAAKAGLVMLTRALARDLAPEVRVNAVAPGAILWPEDGGAGDTKQSLMDRVPAGRMGEPADIAATVDFLLNGPDYINGQIIAVDGGRSVVP